MAVRIKALNLFLKDARVSKALHDALQDIDDRKTDFLPRHYEEYLSNDGVTKTKSRNGRVLEALAYDYFCRLCRVEIEPERHVHPPKPYKGEIDLLFGRIGVLCKTSTRERWQQADYAADTHMRHGRHNVVFVLLHGPELPNRTKVWHINNVAKKSKGFRYLHAGVSIYDVKALRTLERSIEQQENLFGGNGK